jgi:hypothetical protein
MRVKIVPGPRYGKVTVLISLRARSGRPNQGADPELAVPKPGCQEWGRGQWYGEKPVSTSMPTHIMTSSHVG